MYYYKYNNKLIPIEIIGINTDAPFRDCRMKLVINSNTPINEEININKITSLGEMYSKVKNNILLKVVDNKLKNGDLVVFINNDAEKKHYFESSIGWGDDMYEFINNIGLVVDDSIDGSYEILFNEEDSWSILPSCLLKISSDIKRL